MSERNFPLEEPEYRRKIASSSLGRQRTRKRILRPCNFDVRVDRLVDQESDRCLQPRHIRAFLYCTLITMKFAAACVFTLAAGASAFAPAPTSSVSVFMSKR